MHPERRIYFWYCSTHLFKAWRGQLLASSPKGKKAFKDKYGTDFGWEYIQKKYRELQEEKATTGKGVSHRVRLSEKAVNPKNQLKMSVSYVKETCEPETNSFGISKICEQIGMSADELEQATKAKRESYPFKSSDSATEAHSDLRHCHNLVKIQYLQKVVRQRAGLMDSVASTQRPKKMLTTWPNGIRLYCNIQTKASYILYQKTSLHGQPM